MFLKPAIQRAYKVELCPTAEQAIQFARCARAARYCWNRGVGALRAQYNTWCEAVNAYAIGRGLDPKMVRQSWHTDKAALLADGLVLPARVQINIYKLTSVARDTDQPWLGEVPSTVRAQARRTFQRVLALYFKGKIQHPRFALAKGKRRPSFAVQPKPKALRGEYITIPVIGRVRCRENVEQRVQGRVVRFTISHDVDRWYCSIGVLECPRPEVPAKIYARGGLDLNTHAAVFAHKNGSEVFPIPPQLEKLQRQIARAQRELCRRRRPKGQPVSSNYLESKLRLGKLYRTQRRVRADWLHKLTTKLTRSCSRLTIEDLNVRGMTRSAKGSVESPGKNVNAKAGLNRKILAAAFSECRRQLTYKADWYGCELVIADRFFPSSKRCSTCGTRHPSLKLGQKKYVCESCGLVIGRDLNAAINLRDYTESSEGGSPTSEGPGDTGLLKPTERTKALSRPKRSKTTSRDEVGTVLI
jgi:putative transposase